MSGRTMGSETGRRTVVLVVEDEPVLRMMAIDMVEDAGFEAVEAADAIEAIGILEARPDIRLVFTDIDMPRGMDGIRLAAAIRDRWPPIKIILTSGKYSEDQASLPTPTSFFPKPYLKDRVVAEMRRLTA
ncbi:MAG: response regulator [Microvirga sp.]